MMLNKAVMTALVAACLATAGCLQKDVTHTLYVSLDGAVAWVASEANVYSDEKDPGRRIAEEQAFLGPVLLGAHDAAAGFAALGADGRVRTTIVRDERPFHVVTEARFARIDRLLERLFTKAGVTSSARFVTDGNEAALRVRLDFARELVADPAIAPLLDIEHLRIVLTDGEFGAVSGFDVTDSRFATFSPDWIARAETASDAGGTIEFALAWTSR